MEKINVAELLRNCPKGMELDCTMFDDVKLDYIKEYTDFPIKCFIGKENSPVSFNMYGEFSIHNKAKCVIFPKGKTTWEGFVPPCQFKDGDIVTCNNGFCTFISIFEDKLTEKIFKQHCYFVLDDDELIVGIKCADYVSPRFATEEEKAKLFQAIRANDYKWNPETKTLETLIEFKDGDVIANDRYIAIFHKFKEGHMYYHCWYNNDSNNSKFKIDFGIGYIYEYRLASEKEKVKLFQVIKDNSYKWDPETKTLEKLPKFKVGDRIKEKTKDICGEVINVYKTKYDVRIEDKGLYLDFTEQDDWELAPNKFDINTLKPFDKVLVRNHEKNEWQPNFFNKYCKEINSFKLIGICTPSYTNNQHFVNYCIPYEGNEHLLDKTDDCDEFYKIWE